jgi:hypothetical protein
MGTSLECWSDARGAYVLGRVGARALYARLEGTISAELAQRFVERLAVCVAGGRSLSYFADSGDVDCYDLCALKSVMDALITHRHRLERIIARPWAGPLSHRATDFAAAFGSCEYVANAAEFEARLWAVAPSAVAEVQMARVTLRHHAMPREASSGGERCSYAYVFDLSNFERGSFVATRVTQISRRPGGCWVCSARNDAQALRLARLASVREWSQPTSRRPEAFTVQFVDPSTLFYRSAIARL